MYVMCVGLDYHTLPLNLRENFVFNGDELSKANNLLHSQNGILENVILSTCERTEIYAVVEQIHLGKIKIKEFLSHWFHIDLEEISKYIKTKSDEQAVTHLMKVISGMDSPEVGESQILHQIKDAFFTARKLSNTGAIFNHLFQEAITFSKYIHSKYKISEYSMSSTQAGIHEIKTELGSIKDKIISIVGIGEMGQQILMNLQGMGYNKIYLFAEHYSHAEKVANDFSSNVIAKDMSEFKSILANSDSLIMAAKLKEPLISISEINKIRNAKTVVIDLGVPQNIDEDLFVKNIVYRSIDSLTKIIEQNQNIKQKLVREINNEIPVEVNNFFNWQEQLHVVPVISGLRKKGSLIQQSVYNSLVNKLPELNDDQLKLIRRHMKSIVNQLLQDPINEIKELSITKDANLDIEIVKKIFGLNGDLGSDD
ncbi:MAG: glutamyl-tRNA reductase [Firmicutes bacterium]|uniref:Glutamyl-tRNA reductase n=1 Tax=Candidatus Gallilactobacillus intestinavium TaxID=2840838 RepID=A0A9D9E7N9_9LACO|nr:glutamyl-tRNA reductase [Candidatus Gallilactobacillus intestinavium]